MPRTLKTVSDLMEYFQGVVVRGEHHGQPVKEALYPLAGFVLAYADFDPGLQAIVFKEKMVNAFWMHIDGRRYAMSYDHEACCIDVRSDSLRGPTVFTVDNDTSHEAIKTFFEQAKAQK